MTADVIPFTPRPGRPSGATLAALRERNADLADDLRVAADERIEAATLDRGPRPARPDGRCRRGLPGPDAGSDREHRRAEAAA